MTEITSYQEVKDIALSCYWRGCRDHKTLNWTTEQVCAWTYNELENSFDLPIENLMLEIIFFVLTSGLQSTLSEYHRKAANKILIEMDLVRELISLLPDDASELESDLRTLEYIKP